MLLESDFLKAKALVIGIFFLFVSCVDEQQELGNSISHAIDDYSDLNKKLPNNLKEIGITETEEGPIHYLKKTDSTYILWYGKGVGESMVFNSLTKEWKSDRQ